MPHALTEQAATLDRIRPISRGGRHCIFNVLWACRSCNSWRGNRLIAELLEA